MKKTPECPQTENLETSPNFGVTTFSLWLTLLLEVRVRRSCKFLFFIFSTYPPVIHSFTDSLPPTTEIQNFSTKTNIPPYIKKTSSTWKAHCNTRWHSLTQPQTSFHEKCHREKTYRRVLISEYKHSVINLWPTYPAAAARLPFQALNYWVKYGILWLLRGSANCRFFFSINPRTNSAKPDTH